MIKKLAEMNLLMYKPYQGVELTASGEKIALETIRHHRLIELYLSQALGYSWDQIDDEADRLEHAISEEFEDRIDEALGYPTIGAHGEPIPTKQGQIDHPKYRRLSFPSYKTANPRSSAGSATATPRCCAIWKICNCSWAPGSKSPPRHPLTARCN